MCVVCVYCVCRYICVCEHIAVHGHGRSDLHILVRWLCACMNVMHANTTHPYNATAPKTNDKSARTCCIAAFSREPLGLISLKLC